MRKLFEKILLTSLLSVLAAGQAQAQFVLKPSKLAKAQPNAQTGTEMVAPRPSTTEKDQAKAPSTASTIKTRPVNNRLIMGGLGIQKFEAHRDGDGIMLNAIVSNTSSQLVSFNFQISRQSGSKWTLIHEGSRLIGPKDQMGIAFSLPRMNEAVKFKFEVDGGNDEASFSKQFQLKAVPLSFVVRYGTSGNWVPARDYPDDLSDGFDAAEFARLKLRPLGLETNIRKKKSTNFYDPFTITTKLHTSLTVRTPRMLSRSFESRAEAEQFRKTLISLVPDRRLTVESVREQPL